MIKKFKFHNWKSFKETDLNIEQLSFLVGTNASGKSNALDALDFLQRLSSGVTVSECVKEIRGGADWLIMNSEKESSISVVVIENKVEYTYEMAIRKTENGIYIHKETLVRRNMANVRTLFDTDGILPNGVLPTRFYKAKPGKQRRIDLYANTSILSQTENLGVVQDVKVGASSVLKNLRSIFILNPLPNRMRQYVPLSTELNKDGGNVAGLIAGMEEQDKKDIEGVIGEYLHNLPERDVERIWAEKVGRFGADAMLYCEEKWTSTKTQILDARGMSDGTLRFISIVVALLTRPQNSLLVVEEIDNGLHPSRSGELIDMLHTLGEKRNIDVLCTTHNPVLIDELGSGMIPYISFVKRSNQDGSSFIKVLDERENLLELMAEGTIGRSMIKDSL